MTGAGRPDDLVSRWLRDLVRATQWHRRLVASGMLAGSVALALHVLAPPPPPTVAVVAAARDVPAGERLTDRHLVVVRRVREFLPDGAIDRTSAARGATVTSAVRRGEIITDVRLVSPQAVSRLGNGLVAAPVRIADTDAVSLLRPGDLVDVLAAGAAETSPIGEARLVASAVRVLAVPPGASERLGSTLGDGALVLVSTSTATAVRLAGAAVTDRLSVVLRSQP